MTVSAQDKKKEAAAPAAAPAAVPAVDPNTPIATVNDAKITVKDYQELLQRVPPNYQSFIKNQKAKVVNDMITQELLFQEAKKQNLGDDKTVLEMLENMKKQIMVQRLLQKQVADQVVVPDKEVKEYFEAHKEEFNLPERVKAAHILVKTKEEADTVLGKAKKNEDFAKLAQEYSIDPSKVNGGDLGYFERGRMIPEFETAVFALKPGEISGVVKTQFGFHIIKLLDKKPVEARQYGEVEAEIKAKLLQEKQASAFNKLIETLKNQSKVSVDEKTLEKL
jgi:peptidyl-prolyl cis-trans isomerase C